VGSERRVGGRMQGRNKYVGDVELSFGDVAGVGVWGVESWSGVGDGGGRYQCKIVALVISVGC